MTSLYSHIYRNFGFCVVQWEIKNYSLLSSFPTSEVNSPTFYLRGFRTTQWKLQLRRETNVHKRTRFIFQVHLISCDQAPDPFNVECKLYKYCNSNSVYDDWHLLKQINYHGANYFILEAEISTDYFQDVKPFEFDDLLLKCELLVWFPKNADLAAKCENFAIRGLSEDLLRLYESSLDFDVMLVVGENTPTLYIKAHKAILFARNPKFEKSIQANTDSRYFTFDRHNNLEACDRLLRFMYSANMEYSARSPRIAVHEIASIYDVHPVVAYFTPDQLSLTSIVETEELEVSWVIENFFNTEINSFSSPKIMSKNFDTSWQITIYPRSTRNDSYVGLHVNANAGFQRMVWIHFCVRNSMEEIHLKHMRGLVTDERNFIDDTVADRRYLESFFGNESLTLIARFKIVDPNHLLLYRLHSSLAWSGNQKDVTGTSVTKCLPYSEENNYNQFFEDMSRLYGSCAFRDIYLHIGGVICNINRGILGARCRQLYEIARQRGVIILRITSLQTVSRLISFLNCSNYFGPLTFSETFELYDVAQDFMFKTLQIVLLRSLYIQLQLPSLPSRQRTTIYDFALAKFHVERDTEIKSLLSACIQES